MLSVQESTRTLQSTWLLIFRTKCGARVSPLHNSGFEFHGELPDTDVSVPVHPKHSVSVAHGMA